MLKNIYYSYCRLGCVVKYRGLTGTKETRVRVSSLTESISSGASTVTQRSSVSVTVFNDGKIEDCCHTALVTVKDGVGVITQAFHNSYADIIII